MNKCINLLRFRNVASKVSTMTAVLHEVNWKPDYSASVLLTEFMTGRTTSIYNIHRDGDVISVPKATEETVYGWKKINK